MDELLDERVRSGMVSEPTRSLPPIPKVHPSGTCFCGCGETPKRGKFFVQTHDRKAEARVIRERFGDIATFVVWAESHLPKIDGTAHADRV